MVIPVFLVDELDHVRSDLLANLDVKVDTHQQWQVWILRVFLYPFLVQVNLYKLFVLFFTNHGSRVVVFHRLTVKRPHIFFPGKSLFFSSITTDSCAIDRKVTLDSFIDEQTLLAHKVLLFAIDRYNQIKQLGRNFPLDKTKDWGFLCLHTN